MKIEARRRQPGHRHTAHLSTFLSRRRISDEWRRLRRRAGAPAASCGWAKAEVRCQRATIGRLVEGRLARARWGDGWLAADVERWSRRVIAQRHAPRPRDFLSVSRGITATYRGSADD